MTKKIELFDSNKHSGLAWAFQVSPSSCGNHEHYENYIRLIAASDYYDGMGTTHILIEENEEEKRIIGFITLKSSSLVSKGDDMICGVPAIEITELAVDKRFERQKNGQLLLSYAIDLAGRIKNDSIGAKHVILCAEPMSVGFYEKFGFAKLSETSIIPREGWNRNCIPMYMTLPR